CFIPSCRFGEKMPTAPNQPDIIFVSREDRGLILNFEGAPKTRANVAVLFKISTANSLPVTDLQCETVALFEDNAPISLSESEFALKSSPEQFIMHTLLLLDLSGSVDIEALKLASRQFVTQFFELVPETKPGKLDMALYYFDGRADIFPLIDFEPSPEQIRLAIDSLNANLRRDRSTNLNGAVIQGVGALEKKVKSSRATANTFSAGSLVIFTDGKDRAERKTVHEAKQAIAKAGTRVTVYAIGLNCQTCELDIIALREFGGENTRLAYDADSLVTIFGDIAERINEDVASRYLLEYCSPKRKGKHQLQIVIENTKLSNGQKNQVSGSLTVSYSADQFNGDSKVDSSYQCGKR
ncbi:MAG: VWA domain-containing protein, partial [candidate division KSB1 bacterium]|nr:VWA domain-containing protein [candidate division KSB1 bacterium]